jgi:hypothetical protein
MAPQTSMRAVVLKGVRSVAVEERPVPKIQDPKDIIVKVRYTALCGRYASPQCQGRIHEYARVSSSTHTYVFTLISSLNCTLVAIMLLTFRSETLIKSACQ